MSDELYEPSVKQIQEVFFASGVAGWANPNIPRIAIPELPGYKHITFEQEDFRVVDSWCVTPYSQWSWGTTTIYHQAAPVWFMHYSGWYPEQVIPFLKQALYEAYSQNQFIGGRGPERYEIGQYPQWCYQNRPHNRFNFISSFRAFCGKEMIVYNRSPFQAYIGWHDYSGRLVLDNPIMPRPKIISSAARIEQ